MRIRDVTLRDGLQNQAAVLPTPDKLELYERLREAGLQEFQVTSFVSPKRLPQLADAEEVWRALATRQGTRDALIANFRGYERARTVGADRLELVLALSPTYHQKNTHRDQEQSFSEFAEVMEHAREDRVHVGIGLANTWHCAFEGETPEERVMDWFGRFYDLGLREFVLADTTGGAQPRDVSRRVGEARRNWPDVLLRVHLHDAGRGVENARAAIEAGADALDTSLMGLGGSPFAGEVGGNLATEAVVVAGIADLDAGVLDAAGNWLGERLRALTQRGEAQAAAEQGTQ